MSNKPTYYAFSVRNRDKGKSAIWTRLGVVWAHDKGQGLNLDIEALPLNFDGRIVLMPPKSDVQPAESFESEVG